MGCGTRYRRSVICGQRRREFRRFTETFAASGGTQLPTNLSNNGHEFSYGAGAKIGFQANLGASTSLAAAYTSEIGMTELDKYADLFAEQGGFDIPANAKIGLTFRQETPLR